MEYRKLGATGLKVSELCLGCMTFGREADEAESRKMVDRFIELGGNFLDTANVYAAGASEEILGRVIKERRHSLVVATKVRFNANIFLGNPVTPTESGLSRGQIMPRSSAVCSACRPTTSTFIKCTHGTSKPRSRKRCAHLMTSFTREKCGISVRRISRPGSS